MALCWSCKRSEYHDYKDIYGIRCPSCGQKEKDDPARRPVTAPVETVKTQPVKRAATRRSK